MKTSKNSGLGALNSRFGGVLEASMGVLGRLGVLGNDEERPTIVGCVTEQEQDLRADGRVAIFTHVWGPTVTVNKGQ